MNRQQFEELLIKGIRNDRLRDLAKRLMKSWISDEDRKMAREKYGHGKEAPGKEGEPASDHPLETIGRGPKVPKPKNLSVNYSHKADDGSHWYSVGHDGKPVMGAAGVQLDSEGEILGTHGPSHFNDVDHKHLGELAQESAQDAHGRRISDLADIHTAESTGVDPYSGNGQEELAEYGENSWYGEHGRHMDNMDDQPRDVVRQQHKEMFETTPDIRDHGLRE